VVKLKPTTIVGVVSELRKTSDRPLLVDGGLADAEALARELREGGDAEWVRVRGSPKGVEAVIYVIGDELSERDEQALKAARRERVPILVVAAGREAPARVPFVPATAVVRVEPGSGFPVDEIGRALMRLVGEKGSSLARHLPRLRRPFCNALIAAFARKSAIVGAVVFVPGADLPVLTINQLRMVLRICAAYGLEVDAQRAPEIVATIAAGLGFRTVAREVLGAIPIAGWAIKGAIAYTGTRAVGEAAVRYCEARTSHTSRPAGSAA
jgi:uncharacterized protein (DUF697 family)